MNNVGNFNVITTSNDADDADVFARIFGEQKYTIINYTDVNTFNSEGLSNEVINNGNIVLIDESLITNTSASINKIRDIDKNKKNPILIVVLSNNDNVFNKIEYLDIGADEYIVKPYNSLEFISKIKALVRRYLHSERLSANKEHVYKGISLNEYTRDVLINNTKIHLTRKEYDILRILINNPNISVSRDRLFEVLWDYDSEYRTFSDEANLNTHISSLRRKIKLVDKESASLIVTEKCYGYKLGEK
jgi:DNA-binding response OmpR family regulator